MKLTDLGAWPASKAATAKLANQTSAVYVPAGKAPYADLSVVGVKMRHKRSTGFTSKTALPWQNKAFMEGQSRVSGAHAFEMLQSLSDTIHVKMYIHEQHGKPMEFDAGAVMHDVMQCVQHLHANADGEYDREIIKKAAAFETGLQQLRNKIGSLNNEHQQIEDASDWLIDRGWDPAPWITDILDANRKVLTNRLKLEAHLFVVDNVVSYIGNLPSLLRPKSALDEHDKAMVRAVLKNLGILS